MADPSRDDLDNIEHWATLVPDPGRTILLDLVADNKRLRAEVAHLDAICWALNERTTTVVDAEFGFRVGGRACEHPSLTGDRCDACGWTAAWEAHR